MMNLEGVFSNLFDLSDDSLKKRLSQLSIRRIAKGMVVFDHDDVSTGIFAVADGAIEVLEREKNGSYSRVMVLGKGHLFGNSSFLATSSKPMAAVSMEESRLVEIPESFLSEAVKDFPEVADRLFEYYRKHVLTSVLKSCRLFSGLSQGELEWVSSLMERKEFAPNEFVVGDNSPGLDLFVVRRGRVEEMSQKKGDPEAQNGVLTWESLKNPCVLSPRADVRSYRALDEVEVMILPEASWSLVLAKIPSVLDQIHNMFQGSSKDVRIALESVVETVIDEGWRADQEHGGVLLNELHVLVSWKTKSHLGTGKLQRISRDFCSFENHSPVHEFRVGETLEVSYSVEEGCKDFISTLVSCVKGREVCAQILDSEKGSEVDSDSIKRLAKERVRNIVFPPHTFKGDSLSVKVYLEGDEVHSAHILSVNPLRGKMESAEVWDFSESAYLVFGTNDSSVHRFPIRCLSRTGHVVDFQFETQTKEAFFILEETLKNLAGRSEGRENHAFENLGNSTEISSFILRKHFSSAAEFLGAFVGGLEYGVVNLISRDEAPLGGVVGVELILGSGKDERIICLNARVRNSANRQIELELKSPSKLKKYAQWTGRRLVEDQIDGSWKRLRNTLLESRTSFWQRFFPPVSKLRSRV